jgi:hypothetical protein
MTCFSVGTLMSATGRSSRRRPGRRRR